MDESPDPAAVFACEMSLHDACVARAGVDSSVDISEAYNGGDEFLRQMMRVGNLFEACACEDVVFDELENVWPYLLEDRFGTVCLGVMYTGFFGTFDRDDCLRVAYRLSLPMRLNSSLPLPVCIKAINPLTCAIFSRLSIQTIRREMDDDPFDENYGQPFFGIYGVRDDGRLEHITDRATYQEARDVLVNLMTGIEFPEEVIAFSRTLTPRGGSSSP